MKVKPEEYGLEKKKATELTVGLGVHLQERELLIKEFETVSKLEIKKTNLSKFRDLRLKIQRNRTQGINKWHTKAKEWFLAGGKFVDATKRMEIAVNQEMEDKLMQAEKFYERQEEIRIENLKAERVAELEGLVEEPENMDLGNMEEDVYEAYLSSKIKANKEKIAAEKKAEEERLKQEHINVLDKERRKLAIPFYDFWSDSEKDLIFGEQSEEDFDSFIVRVKNKKREHEKKQAEIAKENAKLKAEAVAKEKRRLAEEKVIEAKLKAERDVRIKLEQEAAARKKDEEKALKEAEEKKQAELAKGDSEKVKDLVNDLNNLKNKYIFKSIKSKKMYADVGVLLDKIVGHVNK